MPFGLRTRLGPWNHVLDGSPHPPWEWAIFWGRGRPIVKHRTLWGHLCKKRLNWSRWRLGYGLGHFLSILLTTSVANVPNVCTVKQKETSTFYNLRNICNRHTLFQEIDKRTANFIHCVPEKVTTLSCYNFDIHESILIIFGRITRITSALPSEMLLLSFLCTS